jgi:hypothetical protein
VSVILPAVYRVVEHDDHTKDDKVTDGGPTTWIVEERKVSRIRRDETIELERPFSDVAKRIFQPSSLGVTFFKSAEDAVTAFMRAGTAAIENAKRATARAERALTWVRVWRHHNYPPGVEDVARKQGCLGDD